MYNIICLKFGTKYGPEYVNRLYKAVKRHTTKPFKFHCFTEDATNILPEIIIHNLPHKNINGWWHKLFLFSKEMPIEGRVFFLDLDTLVTGNIDQILDLKGDFITLHDFYVRLNKNHKDKWGGHKEAIGSGLMMWDAGKYSYIWDTFQQDPEVAIKELHPHGDQKWIQKQLLLHKQKYTYFQDLVKNQVVSYKVHCRRGLPQNTRIVCYHGRPSIPESITETLKTPRATYTPQKWVADHWKD